MKSLSILMLLAYISIITTPANAGRFNPIVEKQKKESQLTAETTKTLKTKLLSDFSRGPLSYIGTLLLESSIEDHTSVSIIGNGPLKEVYLAVVGPKNENQIKIVNQITGKSKYKKFGKLSKRMKGKMGYTLMKNLIRSNPDIQVNRIMIEPKFGKKGNTREFATWTEEGSIQLIRIPEHSNPESYKPNSNNLSAWIPTIDMTTVVQPPQNSEKIFTKIKRRLERPK